MHANNRILQTILNIKNLSKYYDVDNLWSSCQW